jgi:hypothetical protein
LASVRRKIPFFDFLVQLKVHPQRHNFWIEEKRCDLSKVRGVYKKRPLIIRRAITRQMETGPLIIWQDAAFWEQREARLGLN